MEPCGPAEIANSPSAREFYYKALVMVSESKVPFLVGGAYALKGYTGITRDTKDLDLFVRPGDVEELLEVFSAAGYQTEITATHWLGKVFFGEYFVDVIFNSGNGIGAVDNEWFEYAVQDEILGIPVRLCPVEEIIVSKSFVMERDRYDGADVAHLIRAQAERLDWERLLRRFGPYWQVLLSQLVLFGFIYPSERDCIPREVMRELLYRLESETAAPPFGEKICRGTFLSRVQYRVDVECWGYKDAVRLTGVF